MKRTYWIDPIETKDDCGCRICKIRNGEKFTVEDEDDFRNTLWITIIGGHEATGNNYVDIIKKSIDETKEKINDKKESNKKERR